MCCKIFKNTFIKGNFRTTASVRNAYGFPKGCIKIFSMVYDKILPVTGFMIKLKAF